MKENLRKIKIFYDKTSLSLKLKMTTTIKWFERWKEIWMSNLIIEASSLGQFSAKVAL
jgi:hypothetical protein